MIEFEIRRLITVLILFMYNLIILLHRLVCDKVFIKIDGLPYVLCFVLY